MTSGGCEILHADCIEVLQTLAENSFDALITDPPYSSGGQYRGDRMQSVTEKYSQSGAKAEYLKHAFEGIKAKPVSTPGNGFPKAAFG